jgi:phosphomannomutase
MLLPEILKREPEDGRCSGQVNRIGEMKLSFADRSWLLSRPSGTKPLVRVCADQESETEMEVLLEQGRKYLLG